LIKLRTPDKFVSVSTIYSNEEIEDNRFSKNYFETSSSTSVQSSNTTLNNVEAAVAPVVAETPAVKEEVKEPELKEEERNVEPEADKPAPVVEEKEVKKEETPTPVVPEAIFVCDAIADKQVFAPNTIFTQTWTVKVVGQDAWPAETTVTYVGGADMMPSYGYNPSVTQEQMEVGDTVDFSVDFQAPAVATNGASLTSFWRLTTKQGVKFGPKLWCEIKVAEPKKEEKELIDVEVVEVLEEKEEIVENENNTEAEPASSQMIFPLLPKESPASSTHEFQGVSLASESVAGESISSGHLIEEDDLESNMSDDFENLSEDDFEFVASDGEESVSGHQ